ncbi:hypothetical protein [Xanthobacter aminoxidans]|uniref:Uncharacterized protein n=1 Tax=Xanthobacter aminoxidans TaxID=186280 RepID=A0ABW6ZQL5_9HYPH
MAAKIETRLMIGGAITPAVLKQLRPLLDEYFSEPQEQVDYALAKGFPITIEEEIYFGSTGDIEAFCEQKGLPFLKWSSGLPGQYDASVRHWQPGMDKPAEFGPAEARFARLSLLEMEAQADDYGVRPQDLARFKRAAHDAVPPIKLEQVATPSVSAGSGVPAAQPLIEVIRNLVRAYDDGLNDDGQRGGARVPTGGDYNRLFEIIMSDPVPAARQVRAPAALGKGPEQEALKVLQAFVSECGGYPPDFLREVFGQAEDLVLKERRRASAPPAAKLPASPIEPAAALEQILGALRLAAPVAEDAIADIYLEGVPLDPTKEAEQRSNLEGAERALEAVRQAMAVAVPLLERFQREAAAAAAAAAALAAKPPMEVYEATAKLNGWRTEGLHWWNALDYVSWDDAQAVGVLYSNARTLCEAEDLDPKLGVGTVFSENCTFITDKFGDVPAGTKDVPLEMVERLRPLLNGENIRVAIKDGQIGLQIEEAFDFTALPFDARVGPELASARTRFPEAEIWLTKGDYIKGGDTDIAMRAFIPATRVAEELVSELSDAIYCMVVDTSGTSFTLSASASPSI